MAPAKFPEDDFVYTISDNESVPDLDESPPPSNRKRKRDTDESNVNGSKTKKNKKDKTIMRKGKNAVAQEESESETEEKPNGLSRAEYGTEIDSDFEFVIGDVGMQLEDFDGWEKKEGPSSKAQSSGTSIEDIIQRRRSAKQPEGTAEAASDEEDEEDEEEFGGFDEEDELLAEDGFGMGATGEDESGEGNDSDDSDEDNSEEEEDSDNNSVAAPVNHPDDLEPAGDSESEAEDDVEAQRRKDFFAPESTLNGSQTFSTTSPGSFQNMGLSRAILKGLKDVGFTDPTPIQAKTVPIALLGKDVVGSAVTGSGKTGAFMLPILERLLHRPKKVPTTRVVVLMPTRELAVQCYNVSTKLGKYTGIRFAQAIGGTSLREQEAILKTRPDVVIATPGRFIDHVKNSPSFAIDTLEILVLDEADRMLEDGFADELNEILSLIPKSRQTMLFSATMTDSVDALIRVGLNRPVRLMVDAKKSTVAGLTQEFIRLRPGKEDKRLAYLMYLCEKVYQERVIVFFSQKKEAHRVRILFGLCGVQAGELHGSMSQEQRLAAISSFRSGATTHLLATDLASRGLDIRNVNTVLNYTTPRTHDIYLHRVGRTARAGRSGRSCTLASEKDRKVVKAAVKSARSQGAIIKSRSVPADEVAKWEVRLKGMEEEIEDVLREEKEVKGMEIAERELTRGENIVKHEKEIMSRPRREWFQTETQKQAAKDRGAGALLGKGDDKGQKGEKKKLSGKQKKRLEEKDMRREGKVWKKGKNDAASAGKKPGKKPQTGAKHRGGKPTAKAGGRK